MPKIYDNPKAGEKERPTGETQAGREKRNLGSGPAGPMAKTENRATLLAIVVILAIVFAIALYRMVGG